MKKVTAIIIAMQVVFIFFAQVADARPIWQPNALVIGHQLTYLSVYDTYKLVVYVPKQNPNINAARLNFWSSDDTYYYKDFDYRLDGRLTLTCNGRYIVELFEGGLNGTKVAETAIVWPKKIKNPTCDSSGNEGQPPVPDELDVKPKDGGKKNDEGKVEINWNPIEGAERYDIYKDGDKIGSTTDTKWYVDDSGTYTVVAVGSGSDDGDALAVSDYISPHPFDGGVKGCDGCKFLQDMLACPAWDQYMGDLTNAIKDALPPPPNWDEVAQTFVDHFADYFGDVPAVPSKPSIDNNIRPPLPNVDTSAPNANIVPSVPNDYNNGPIAHDIRSGPQIEIVDGSEEIEIYEPDKYINSDPVGEMVFPNDPRNHSDGIKTPNQVEITAPQPTPNEAEIEPQPTPKPSDDNIPSVELPMPSTGDSPVPTPKDSDYIIPIPRDAKGG